MVCFVERIEEGERENKKRKHKLLNRRERVGEWVREKEGKTFR